MTKINLLEKRKKSIDQRMNRLHSQEAVLNVQLRKRRTRRLIELGGLVSKAQLEDWNASSQRLSWKTGMPIRFWGLFFF